MQPKGSVINEICSFYDRLSESEQQIADFVMANQVEVPSMTTREIAQQHRFLSSPTIRVNGRDICTKVAENDCGCCGEISGAQVDCRVFKYGGKIFEVPPKAMLANAVLSAIFRSDIDVEQDQIFTMPENLTRFYNGKQSKSGCTCEAENCCKS